MVKLVSVPYTWCKRVKPENWSFGSGSLVDSCSSQVQLSSLVGLGGNLRLHIPSQTRTRSVRKDIDQRFGFTGGRTVASNWARLPLTQTWLGVCLSVEAEPALTDSSQTEAVRKTSSSRLDGDLKLLLKILNFVSVLFSFTGFVF